MIGCPNRTGEAVRGVARQGPLSQAVATNVAAERYLVTMSVIHAVSLV